MRRAGLLALAILLLEGPSCVAAQTTEPRAHASAELSLAGVRIQESTRAFAGAAGLLSLNGRFSFGAAGRLLLGSATVAAEGAGSDLDLRMAYGGLLLEMILGGSRDRHVALRGLIGVGNAKVESVPIEPLPRSELGADNFGVVESEIVGTIPVVGRLGVGLGAGYRWVFGVEDLPNVAHGDLVGFSGRVHLAIRTR